MLIQILLLYRKLTSEQIEQRNNDLATELGYRTKMISLFAKAMDFDDGEYGNGILSKLTIFKNEKYRFALYSRKRTKNRN